MGKSRLRVRTTSLRLGGGTGFFSTHKLTMRTACVACPGNLPGPSWFCHFRHSLNHPFSLAPKLLLRQWKFGRWPRPVLLYWQCFSLCAILLRDDQCLLSDCWTKNWVVCRVWLLGKSPHTIVWIRWDSSNSFLGSLLSILSALPLPSTLFCVYILWS